MTPVPLPLSNMGLVVRLDTAEAALDSLCCGSRWGEADVSSNGASPSPMDRAKGSSSAAALCLCISCGTSGTCPPCTGLFQRQTPLRTKMLSKGLQRQSTRLITAVSLELLIVIMGLWWCSKAVSCLLEPAKQSGSGSQPHLLFKVSCDAAYLDGFILHSPLRPYLQVCHIIRHSACTSTLCYSAHASSYLGCPSVLLLAKVLADNVQASQLPGGSLPMQTR